MEPQIAEKICHRIQANCFDSWTKTCLEIRKCSFRCYKKGRRRKKHTMKMASHIDSMPRHEDCWMPHSIVPMASLPPNSLPGLLCGWNRTHTSVLGRSGRQKPPTSNSVLIWKECNPLRSHLGGGLNLRWPHRNGDLLTSTRSWDRLGRTGTRHLMANHLLEHLCILHFHTCLSSCLTSVRSHISTKANVMEGLDGRSRIKMLD